VTVSPTFTPSPRLRRKRRRRTVVRWAIRIGAAAVIFGIGVALGQTLDDNPDPAKSPTTTSIRTLGPLPLSSPSTVTVTVTRP
jgi:hypothetical protein